ncbi:histidine kinase [Sphingomonas sp. LaA6.9]|uniref:histidine kinase n=1 Tax=Sphingomonas sp. LaA6.9 TaxID=2919914 RepID=UPI001F4FB24C|nr:histidine kinase [Sphingomonas sp. LaA6.9]MCJ8156197.1 histidine kinase [Sphingomonas sp. LaA6.9]
MGRFLAGVASALLLAGAGIFWWQSRAESEPRLPLAPAVQSAGLPLSDDPVPDPPEASAKTREEKRFGRYDKDRNGGISTEEYFASRRKAFAKLDANRDGRLSFDEWGAKTREKFAKADTDRSQVLNRAEFATTAPVRKSRPKPDCPPAIAARGEEDDG